MDNRGSTVESVRGGVTPKYGTNSVQGFPWIQGNTSSLIASIYRECRGTSVNIISIVSFIVSISELKFKLEVLGYHPSTSLDC